MTVRRLAVRLAALAVLSLLTSGCLTAAALHLAQEERENARLRVFDPAEHAWALARGGPVTGRVLIITPALRPPPAGYGPPVPTARTETLTCAGLRVRLIPDSEHMRWQVEWTSRLKVERGGYWTDGFGIPADAWDWPAESAAFVRETRCGADGTFAFDNVPDGPWLVMAEINPPEYYASTVRADWVVKPVTVRGGAPLNVDLGSDSWVSQLEPPQRHTR